MRSDASPRIWIIGVAFAACVSAGIAPAQREFPLEWERVLAARIRRAPEVADWLIDTVGPRGIPRIAESLGRGWQGWGAAEALKRFGLHHVEPYLESPYADVRDVVTASVLSLGNRQRYYYATPWELLPAVQRRAVLSEDPSFAELLDGLESPDPGRRVLCLASLRAFRPRLRFGDLTPWEHTERALAELKGGCPVRRRGSLLALVLRTFEAEHVERVDRAAKRALADPDPGVRRTAYEIVSDRRWGTATDEMPGLIRRALADHPSIAITCVDRLATDLGPGDATNALVNRLADAAVDGFANRPDPVREAILRLLGTASHVGSLSVDSFDTVVAPSLCDPSPGVRRAALGAARSRHARRVAATVIALVGDESPRVRAEALRVIGWELGTDGSSLFGAIEAGVRDPFVAVRQAAVGALFTHRSTWNTRRERLAIAALEDPSPFVRRDVVWRLKRVPPSADVAAALVARLTDSSRIVIDEARVGLLAWPRVAKDACFAAAQARGDPTPVSELGNLLAELLAMPRLAGAESLAWLLSSGSARARSVGLIAATRLGGAARAVGPSISSVLARPCSEIEAMLAARALVSIGPSAAVPESASKWAAWTGAKWKAEALPRTGAASLDATLRRARERHGVAIEFPAGVRVYDGLPVEALPLGQRLVAATAVAAALARYSPVSLAGRLRRVVVIRRLWLQGAEVGGMYSGDAIYLAAVGAVRHRHLTSTLHHELSSLFAREQRFPWDTWRAANAPDERYQGNAFSAIRKGLVGVGGPDLFERGFFAPYATATAEEDFNVFSEVVRTDPAWARACIERYPALRRKWGAWCACMGTVVTGFQPPFTVSGAVEAARAKD